MTGDSDREQACRMFCAQKNFGIIGKIRYVSPRYRLPGALLRRLQQCTDAVLSTNPGTAQVDARVDRYLFGDFARQMEALAGGAVTRAVETADGPVFVFGHTLADRINQSVPGVEMNHFTENDVAHVTDFNPFV